MIFVPLFMNLKLCFEACDKDDVLQVVSVILILIPQRTHLGDRDKLE
jgi:hypothetical protein